MRSVKRVAAVSAAAIAAGIGLLQLEARASSGVEVRLRLGDRIRLNDAEVGCRVTRLVGHGRHVYLDCRRAGRLRGTYGVYVGDERVRVVRFVDSRTARVVFSAEHEVAGRTCDR
jgi:hypothetical protein